MDVAFRLAEHIVHTDYDRLPAQVVEVAKKFIIDTIGVGIAGSSAPGNQEIIELLKAWGGKKQSRILVYGMKMPAPQAAFANSLLIHSADYDDTFDRTATHTNVTSLPAALAIAELLGLNGRSLITAVALGVDLTCRLALASHLYHGWHNTTTVGIFGAVTAAGKMLGLDETQMVNALGIAYSQAAGNRQGREDGAQTKRLQPAFATKAGVMSALLAQRGVSGAQNIFQGQWGFFRLYRDYEQPFEPEQWAEALTSELGIRFEGVNLGAKPYPCVRCSHAPIDGALMLAGEHDIDPADIEEVTVFTNERVIDTAGGPFVLRTNPEVDAKFSIPYTVALALARKKVTLADFKEETIRNADIGRLAKIVKVVLGPEFKDSLSTMGPIELSVRLKNGTELCRRVELASGHPQNPMSPKALLDKFMDCTEHSARPISKERIDQLLDSLNRMETVDDVGRIMKITAAEV
jgi:2-methylcitrate dehydratase PrpD